MLKPFVPIADVSNSTIQQNKELTAQVDQLKTELEVWKQSRTAVADDAVQLKRQHEEEKHQMLRRIKSLESSYVS